MIELSTLRTNAWTPARWTSWQVRLLTFPAAAYAIAASAFNPEFESVGLVWAKVNAPRSGRPSARQPRGSTLNAAISPQPIALFGQPRRRASGSHIAITTGLLTNTAAASALLPTIGRDGGCCCAHFSLRRLSHQLLAGSHASTWSPARMRSIDAPEPIGVALMVIGPSHARIRRALKSAMAGWSHSCFSLP